MINKTPAIKHSFSLSFILKLAITSFILFTSQKSGTDTLPNDSLVITGKASYYANLLHGLNTSSGDLYDKNDFTCAHRTLPFNTLLRVTNIATCKSVIVRVNDRGPYKKGRVIDLSRAAAQKLGMVKNGVTKVQIELLTSADSIPLNDSLIHKGEVLDAHGNHTELVDKSIYVWNTHDLKHAIYMATDIEKEYPVNCVYLKAFGEADERSYRLYLSRPGKKEECDTLIANLKQNGFPLCRYAKN